MGQNASGNLAVQEHDFVTVYTAFPVASNSGNQNNLAPQNIPEDAWQKRQEQDRAILEAARGNSLVKADDLLLSRENLDAFHLTLRNLDGATNRKAVLHILQNGPLKIVVELRPENQLVIEAFEKGRLRRVAHATEEAIREYLTAKNLIATPERPEPGAIAIDLIDSPQFPNDLTVCDPARETLPAQDEALEIVAIEPTPSAIAMSHCQDALIDEAASALALLSINEDASYFKSESSALIPSETFSLETEDSVDGTASALESPAAFVAEESAQPAFINDAVPATEPAAYVDQPATLTPEEEREIGLKINTITAKLTTAYDVEDIRTGLNQLSEYEARTPGILMGLNIPSFEDACLASYRRILTNKHGFIDDLDRSLMKMGIEGGIPDEDVRKEMANRALELFNTGLNAMSGKPLKKSRAEKLMNFASICGKAAMLQSPQFPETKMVVRSIFIHETQKTLKAQRDREMCKIYLDLNTWAGNDV